MRLKQRTPELESKTRIDLLFKINFYLACVKKGRPSQAFRPPISFASQHRPVYSGGGYSVHLGATLVGGPVGLRRTRHGPW